LSEKASSNRDFKAQNQRIREQYDGKGKMPSLFFDFARKAGARYSVVLNVSTRSLEQNRKWLTTLAKQDVKIPAFEIGNELYFGSYAWAIKTPSDYVQCAKEHTALIRKLFPDAKVGVIVPSHIYTSEVFLDESQPNRLKRQEDWMTLLEKERFFDAVVIHLYSKLGMSNNVKEEDFLPLIEAYSNVVAYAESHLDKSLDLLEKTFPGKDIWITEYGVGGFGGELRQYQLRHSHLGCLHSDLMLLRFLSRPSITISHWQSFSQCISFDRKMGGIHEDSTVQLHHLSLFADPVNNSDSYVPVTCTNGAQLEVGAFSGSKRGYIFVLNKRNQSHILKKLTSKKNIQLTGAIQLSPQQKIPLASALEKTQSMDKTELTGKALGSIVFPPYSITRIEFDWE